MSTALEMQPIEIFRAGNYGAKGNFTTADLDRIAAAYKPEQHEAPAVIGHPQANLPAWGWVKSLKRDGQSLMASFQQVAPEFAEMVEAGRFKKRSASFYRDPVTKVVTGLRHVGFLGAQPPDVKGLKDVEFEDNGQEVTEFEESDMADQNEQAVFDRVWNRIKEAITGTAGTPAQTSFSEADVKRIAGEAVAAAVAPLQTELAAAKTEFSESQKKQATTASKNRAADAIAKFKREGRYVPAFDKMGLSVVFEELAKSDEVIEFGEGDNNKSATAFDTLVSFMEELPAIVPAAPSVFSGQTTQAAKVAGINDNGRAPADPNSVALDKAVQERMVSAKVDYGTALTQVSREKPELTKPGGATAGAV